jgi:hypothetical protein
VEDKNLQRELSIGEILSQTFNLYSRNFAHYPVPFLVAGILTGLVTMIVRLAIVIPEAPADPTSQLLLAWFPTFIAASATSLFLSGIVSWIAGSFTTGITIKFTSDTLESGQANLQKSFHFTLTKVLYLLAASIITVTLMALGFIALIIPGIIIALIFSLVNPAIMLEGKGVLGSLSRSRVLVRNRWLKTFGLFFVVGIIVAVVNGLAVLIAGQFGLVSPLISGILTAFITPIVPIATTLYYYSMKARTLQPPPPPPLSQTF